MAGPVVVVLVLAVALLGAVLLVNLASYAYGRLGLDGATAFAVLFLSILGSWLNIPVAHLHATTTFEPMLVRVYGVLYVVPEPVRVGSKVVAVNVGGAVIPTILSAYLVIHDGIGWQALLATTVVALVVYRVARIVPGIGIVAPTLVPPLTAALVAWAVDVTAIAAVAYVAGTLGTLVGADLLNLPRIRRLDAPVVSMGGAGTFDGIFVTGIVAVLLATI
ncbi:MAG TPA: DUF1614 domain-containing protein [Acidimicrobiia bacterium]|nr:DUF1614 domain-containing protein [Acidimicrobiia bacterium]